MDADVPAGIPVLDEVVEEDEDDDDAEHGDRGEDELNADEADTVCEQWFEVRIAIGGRDRPGEDGIEAAGNHRDHASDGERDPEPPTKE